MKPQEKFFEKAHSRVHDLNKQIDRLQNRMEKSPEHLQEQYRHRINELSRRAQKIDYRLKELSGGGQEAFEDLKHGVEKAIVDLRHSVDDAFKRLKH